MGKPHFKALKGLKQQDETLRRRLSINQENRKMASLKETSKVGCGVLKSMLGFCQSVLACTDPVSYTTVRPAKITDFLHSGGHQLNLQNANAHVAGIILSAHKGKLQKQWWTSPGCA